MHMSEGWIKGLYYGFDKDSLHLRIDPLSPWQEHGGLSLQVTIIHGNTFRVLMAPFEEKTAFLERSDNQWRVRSEKISWAFRDVFELALPFAALGAQEGDELKFSVEVVHGSDIAAVIADANGVSEHEIERVPWKGFITINVPPPDYDKLMWY
jgi:hypothetical protein